MPESGITKHNYLFCQFVNPARGHEGDRCDCFDTPSQRRTTLAKQRLARLRADREINRASTSTDTESAVASDPAVTHIELIHLLVHAGENDTLREVLIRMVGNVDARIDGINEEVNRVLCTAKVIWKRDVEQVISVLAMSHFQLPPGKVGLFFNLDIKTYVLVKLKDRDVWPKDRFDHTGPYNLSSGTLENDW